MCEVKFVCIADHWCIILVSQERRSLTRGFSQERVYFIVSVVLLNERVWMGTVTYHIL